MSQNDFTIANQGFPAFRSDLNSALQAIATNNSGATQPSTMFANMWWYDSATDILYIRNEDNDNWIKVAELDQSNDKINFTGKIQLDDGTVADPALTFNSDTNMGLYRGGTDILKFVTAGADRLTIDANGNVLASNGTITANRASADQNILGEATTAGHASRLQLKAQNYSGGAYNSIQSFQGDATPAWEISGPKANATNIMLLSTGGTERMRIDATGCVTMPLQPAFQALPTGDNNNVTGNATTFGAVNIPFTEIFDNNGDFNHDDGIGRGKFTAPVAGRYLLGISCFFSGTTSASTSGVVAIATSNRTYNRNFNPYNVANIGVNGNYNFCILADMDAGDTASFSLYVNGNGSNVVDLAGSQSSFYGNLVC